MNNITESQSHKTIPFQFRIPDSLRSFVNQKFPKNASKGISEIIDAERIRVETGVKRLEMLKNARETLDEIKLLEKSGGTISNLYYDFLFNLISYANFHKEECDYFEIKHAVRLFIEPVDLILQDIKRSMPNIQEIDYLDYLLDKISNKEFKSASSINTLVELVNRLFRTLLQYKMVDNYLRIGLNRFISVIEPLPEKTYSLKNNKGVPIVYGSSTAPLLTSVAMIESLGTEPSSKEILLIKKAVIGFDSPENFIEYIISSYLDSLQEKKSVQDYKWIIEDEKGNRCSVHFDITGDKSFKMSRLINQTVT
ncbi:hypothetical protein JCM30760_26430 [Thiomicrorhabdus hydrogeniphila]